MLYLGSFHLVLAEGWIFGFDQGGAKLCSGEG